MQEKRYTPEEAKIVLRAYAMEQKADLNTLLQNNTLVWNR